MSVVSSQLLVILSPRLAISKVIQLGGRTLRIGDRLLQTDYRQTDRLQTFGHLEPPEQLISSIKKPNMAVALL